jgi:hypothetical protein
MCETRHTSPMSLPNIKCEGTVLSDVHTHPFLHTCHFNSRQGVHFQHTCHTMHHQSHHDCTVLPLQGSVQPLLRVQPTQRGTPSSTALPQLQPEHATTVWHVLVTPAGTATWPCTACTAYASSTACTSSTACAVRYTCTAYVQI